MLFCSKKEASLLGSFLKSITKLIKLISDQKDPHNIMELTNK